MADSTFARVTSGAPVSILVAPGKHQLAAEEIRRALRGQVVQMRPLAASVDLPDSLTIVLADVSDLDAAVRRAFDVDNLGLLADDAYFARARTIAARPVVALVGGRATGALYAARELIDNWLEATSEGVEIRPFDVSRDPAMTYRMFWTWDHSTNWYLQQPGLQDSGFANYYAKPTTGFVEDYRRLIDFMSRNRLNGLVIYGFLRDNHGGVEAAKEIARYGKERGVRVIPGVGINAYGGIYWEGRHRYNLSTWLREHPELRAQLDRELEFPMNYYGELACPSKTANRAYHQEAIHWLCEEFEIGRVNFETGDYGVCQCPECQERRKDAGHWSLDDIVEFYPALFDAATSARSNLWLISEAYFDNVLDLATIAPLAQLPKDTVCQYCINRPYWPRVRNELTAEHVSRLPLRTNVMRTHMGSQANGERYQPVARTFADLARLVTTTGMQGMNVFGEVSSFSVINEINYLAYATFAYDRAVTWKQFVAGTLAPRLGGVVTAEEYLRLLETPAEAPALQEALGRVREIATPLTDAEQHRRWTWLANRLYETKAML